jgi:hypothetical protein
MEMNQKHMGPIHARIIINIYILTWSQSLIQLVSPFLVGGQGPISILKNVDMDPCDPNSASNSAYKKIRKSVTAMSASRQSKKGLKEDCPPLQHHCQRNKNKERQFSKTTNLITTSPILLLLLLQEATIKHQKQSCLFFSLPLPLVLVFVLTPNIQRKRLKASATQQHRQKWK